MDMGAYCISFWLLVSHLRETFVDGHFLYTSKVLAKKRKIHHWPVFHHCRCPHIGLSGWNDLHRRFWNTRMGQSGHSWVWDNIGFHDIPCSMGIVSIDIWAFAGIVSSDIWAFAVLDNCFLCIPLNWEVGCPIHISSRVEPLPNGFGTEPDAVYDLVHKEHRTIQWNNGFLWPSNILF